MDVKLSAAQYRTVRSALLKLRPQWRNIGLALGFPLYRLNEFTGSYSERMDQMLEVWIQETYSIPTWRALVDALRDEGVEGGIPVAREIETKYGGGGSSSSAMPPPSVSSSTPSSAQRGVLSQNDLKQVRKSLLPIRAQWYDIGLELGISPSVLGKLASDHPNHSNICFTEMLTIWLTGKNTKPTWEALIGALREIGEESLAVEIETRHPTTGAGQYMSDTHRGYLDAKPKIFELAKYKVIDTIEPRWQDLAYALYFESATVQAIKVDNKDSVKDACTAMLAKWLDGGGERGPRTWRTLIDALNDIEKTELAKDLLAALRQ